MTLGSWAFFLSSSLFSFQVSIGNMMNQSSKNDQLIKGNGCIYFFPQCHESLIQPLQHNKNNTLPSLRKQEKNPPNIQS